MKRLELLEREGELMRVEDATNEVATIIARIIALKDQLSRTDLPAPERAEITEQISVWRLRLAVLLHTSD